MSEENKPETGQTPQDPHQHTRRDAETQIALGIFVTAISLPVLLGTFWADSLKAVVVNVAAGLVLLGVGVAMALWGVMTRRTFS